MRIPVKKYGLAATLGIAAAIGFPLIGCGSADEAVQQSQYEPERASEGASEPRSARDLEGKATRGQVHQEPRMQGRESELRASQSRGPKAQKVHASHRASAARKVKGGLISVRSKKVVRKPLLSDLEGEKDAVRRESRPPPVQPQR